MYVMYDFDVLYFTNVVCSLPKQHPAAFGGGPSLRVQQFRLNIAILIQAFQLPLRCSFSRGRVQVLIYLAGCEILKRTKQFKDVHLCCCGDLSGHIAPTPYPCNSLYRYEFSAWIGTKVFSSGLNTTSSRAQ